ncbi:S-norcoclaurine synthase 1-like [Impatiens glandulifera]|uniref:S-norcoclaurine synthase 1-like n=1 Tax=Impatiens glandulifera TaxID=253017 RepID=UPI001FB19337|nr:S-norcoclaurine synthase 1-like [Impatiens glandulifera]
MENQTESTNKRTFGGSLPVENVQQLFSKNSKQVPTRYLRPELTTDNIWSKTSLQVPIIDMSKLSTDKESTHLHIACKDWGFFQLINHGISQSIDEMKSSSKDFFNLPLENKLLSGQIPGSIEGYGQAFVLSEDQKLDWGDMLFLISLPEKIRKMRFWPENLRDAIERYSGEVSGIAMRLIEKMGENLGVDLMGLFEDGVQGIRINYYPPCIEAERVVGLTSHSDATALTLLSQVNDVEGLQIMKDGKWLPVCPIDGAIIVNIGDIFEIMSNGEYKSIEHRVMVNPEKERLSIAAFNGPNMKCTIRPFPELTKENGTKYKTLSYDDFTRLVVNRKLNGKSLLDQIRIEKQNEQNT